MIAVFRLGTLRSLLILFLFTSEIAIGRPITISAISNLNFSTAVQGDGILVVPPGTRENRANASFFVRGAPNVTYTIILPTSAKLAVRKGPIKDTIMLTAFTSFPSNVGLLNLLGFQFLYVGATRAAIRNNQLTGSYSGSFSVTVVY